MCHTITETLLLPVHMISAEKENINISEHSKTPLEEQGKDTGTGEAIHFLGQQQGERILYRFSPHPIALVFSILKLFVAVVSLVLISILLSYAFQDRRILTIGQWFSALVGIIVAFWLSYKWSNTIAFVTDRRVVRMTPAFWGLINRRSIFWRDVIKIKSINYSLPLRILKIGGILIKPISIGGDEDLRLDYVSYYEDLVNYMDKILFITKSDGGKVRIRHFVPKPAGKRY